MTGDRTLRQIFGDFKKSTACFELKSYLIRKQLFMCPITKMSITLNEDTHLSHIISLKQLTQLRAVNPSLALLLTTDPRNLFLEKAQSNKKRSSRPCEELLQDVLDQFQFTETDLAALKL